MQISRKRIQIGEGHWVEIPTHPLLRALAHLELALFDSATLWALRSALGLA
jgi:hypothetical protein